MGLSIILKYHKIKILLFCLLLIIIIVICIKYGTDKKNSQTTKPSVSPSIHSQPPISISSTIPIISPYPDQTNNPYDTSSDISTTSPIHTNIPIYTDQPIVSPYPTYTPTTTSTSLPNAPTMPSTESRINDTYAPINSATTLPITKSPRPTSVSTPAPLLNAKEGEYCLYNDTCTSRVCANSQQSLNTVFHNTCVPSGLLKGTKCYKDESCKNYSCAYNWSVGYYTCN
jgi:hypothetical protein